MRKTAYKAGKVIIKEGDRGNEGYIIVDGEVEVTRLAQDGSEIVLGRLTDNQMFGEVSMIDDSIPRIATVRASKDVVVAVISQESFLEKLQTTPVAVKSTLKVLAKRLADTYDMFIDLHSKIYSMVRQQVGHIMDENRRLKEELKERDEQISLLEAQIEELKITGPTKTIKPATTQSQKLEKDRSMKISLKDLDQIAKQQKDNNT